MLSSDPSRNTFRCTTCVLLPLPTRECDSDSDSDCDMPSRQQDYPVEAQADIAKDMNEVKGAVQDLSNLCKDMLREINDIKSINLTLRCGIENLRHENEERDQVIADLKHRLDNFENSKGTVNKTVKCTVCNNVLEKSTEDSVVCDDIRAQDKYVTTRQTAYEETGTVEETTFREHEEVIKSEVNSFVTEESKENRQDWTWKGRKAVELEESAEESVEEEGVTEGSEVGEETAHGWETLQEELESEYKVKEEVVYTAIKVNVESSTYSDEEILNSEYETETEDESLIEKDPHNEEDNKYSDKDDNSEGEAKSFLRASSKIKQEPIEEEEADEDKREEYSLENKNTFQEERDIEAESEVELNQHEAESKNSKENYYENKITESLQLKAKQPSFYDSGEEKEEEDINENETHSTLEVNKFLFVYYHLLAPVITFKYLLRCNSYFP